MSEHRVVVTDYTFDDLSIERQALGDIADVEVLADDEVERREQLREADAIINLIDVLDEDFVAQLENCRIISRYGIGVDNIAVDAASERGIYVTNVPDYCIEEVAIHAVSMLLSLARRLKQYDDQLRRGDWRSGEVLPIERRFSEQTVGVVGYGAIGRAVGERLAALGADVVASDPFLEPADLADEPADLVEFDALLERSDFVTVHSPLTEETEGLFDAETFAKMKPGAHLINVARGPIVEQDALLDALDEGDLAAAALDVFEEEPLPEDNPLRTHDRVLVSPHIAWYSETADTERREKLAADVRAALVGELPKNVVNADAVENPRL